VRNVNVGHKFLADYRSIVPRELADEIRELAEPLRGRRVLHVNATAFGGGVAEILYTFVPLMTDAGLPGEWQVITAPPEFFGITKGFHNGLQGAAFDLTPQVRELYENVGRSNAEALSHQYDFVIVHDPQPLAMRHFLPDARAIGRHWIWRCHIDTSTPNQELYDYLVPFIDEYDAVIYTMPQYAPASLRLPVTPIPPSIDPLAPKNMALSAWSTCTGSSRRSGRTSSLPSWAPWPPTTRRAGSTWSASWTTPAAMRTCSSSPTSTTSAAWR
jgi:trehalose synthase